MKKARNPQDSTRSVQGRRDRGQDARSLGYEKRIEALEERCAILEKLMLDYGIKARKR